MSTASNSRLAFAALAAAVLGAGCVVDTALKVGCGSKSDCLEGRVCMNSVCQSPVSLTLDAGMEHANDTSTGGPEASRDAPQDPLSSSDGPVEVAAETKPETAPPMDADGGDAATDAPDAADAGKISDGRPNYAFLTSRTIRTRFTPLDVADAFCQTVADDAALPGTFRAWLSNDTANVIERFKGARGWMRPDGLPFGDTLADLVAGRILYPLGLDEHGKPIVDERDAYVGLPATGTTVDGLFDVDNSCITWTSTDNVIGRAAGGYVNAGGPLWDTGDSIICSYEVRLLCLGIDRAVPVSAALAPMNGRVGFITDKTWASGKGIGTADALCASEASAAKLPGTFKALLGSTKTTIGDRLQKPDKQQVWVRPDGIALTGLSLFGVAGSFLGAAWDVTASGKHVPDVRALVGASSLYVAATANQNCNDWTSTTSAQRALAAEVLRPDLWLDSPYSIDCATPTRIMCLQDPLPPAMP